MKKPFVIHPFLFAIFPIMFLFSYNIGELFVYDIVVPIVIVLIFTLLLLLLLHFILKDIKKAGIVVSLLLIFFFSYGHFYKIIGGLRIGGFEIGRHRYFLPIYVTLIALGVYFTLKTRKDLNNFTKILNITSIFLIAISLINIGIYEFKTRTSWFEIMDTEEIEDNLLEMKKTDMLPNIYYIILDGYVASSVLKEWFNFNNHEFTDYLTSKGFYVTTKSRSNYAVSNLSVASSLNMEYINHLSEIVRVRNDFRIPIMMVKDSKVRYFLKKIGYKFIHIGSWGRAKTLNPEADLIFRRSDHLKGFGFVMIIARTTMLNPIHDYLSVYISREQTLYSFDKLTELVPHIKDPTFVFAHIYCPHTPYVFDQNGEMIDVIKSVKTQFGNDWGQQGQLYLGQLIFMNRKVERLVDILLSKSNRPPIIIIQADHGWTFNYDNSLKPGPEKIIKQRMSIFNAYYLPDGGVSLLYDSISPVNSFRLILKYYFDVNIDLLDDYNYFSTFSQPYKFTDVTEYFD